MELKLLRKYLKPSYTIGHLYIDGKYFCDTLEDTVRDLVTEKKVKGRTAIPAGRYRVVLNWSPRFGKPLPLLLDVPHFEGIRIHAGNTAKDTEGCILVGRNTQPGTLTESKVTMQDLMQVLTSANNRRKEIWITVE